MRLAPFDRENKIARKLMVGEIDVAMKTLQTTKEYTPDNTNENWAMFKTALTKLRNDYIHIKYIRKRRRWITNEIFSLNKAR